MRENDDAVDSNGNDGREDSRQQISNRIMGGNICIVISLLSHLTCEAVLLAAFILNVFYMFGVFVCDAARLSCAGNVARYLYCMWCVAEWMIKCRAMWSLCSTRTLEM